jgi:hypothetical protein
MVVYWIVDDRVGLLRFSKANELNGCSTTLMEQLKETMLSVCARLTEIHDRGLVINYFPMRVNPLSVALHIQLLNMRGEFA